MDYFIAFYSLQLKKTNLILFFVLLTCCSFAFSKEYDWSLPKWLSPPLTPLDNPMSDEKVALGKRLFYDANLSGLGYMSCSSCHILDKSFTDQRGKAVGIKGDIHLRGSMPLINLAYLSTLNWADPHTTQLEQQALIPLFGHNPIIEMAVKGHEENVLLFLQRDPTYPNMFKKAFGENSDIDFSNITKALASFERTLISYQSPFDQYYYEGDKTALSSAAIRGLDLFLSDLTGCSSCHTLPHFTDATEGALFHNTGLYNMDEKGAYPTNNQGLYEHTKEPHDKGKFRTPTLRNIALTAPYMHDGSVLTLDEAIKNYMAGSRSALQGKTTPLLSDKIKSFTLTQQQQNDLIAFLQSLTDQQFITNSQFDSPFK